MFRLAAVAGLMLLCGCGKTPQAKPAAAVATYVDARSCAGCHAAIAKSYAKTAMARAFYKVTPAAMRAKAILGSYSHRASGRTYTNLERGGRFFQTRTENGNYLMEREIHYVMGSGEHARSFLHRTAQGRLVELPMGWYAEGGGALAMSPGYDRADPLDFRRKISTDCLFCHNGYPAVTSDAPSHEPAFPEALPEGIDCQRCHGPGSAHIASGGKGGIVNPAKIGPDRAMEVCMQCHLETTSRPLPNSLLRVGRGAFSYRPGEPLEDFVLHFDHGKGAGREDKFEIVNSVYRLRQARCFLESGGKMGCTTCHNPHDVPRGAAARTWYAKACASCHAEMAKTHAKGDDCAGCHMPKRRAEDVVHAVMTDHKIVRRPPPGNLLASRKETHEARFEGEVALYYPPQAKNAEVYLAVAQVIQKSNLQAGIARLEAASGKPPEAVLALGQAYEAAGKWKEAEAKYREASIVPAMKALGELLQRQGRAAEAVAVLEKAGSWYWLGLAYRDLGRRADAVAALEKAIAEDGDYPAAYNSLGGVYFEMGDGRRAEAALREALRQQPDFAEAHSNLGQVLAAGGHFTDAEVHLRDALKRNRGLPEAWRALGEVQSARGAWTAARHSFQEALRIAAADEGALLGLGIAEAATGDLANARAHLFAAARSGNPAIRDEARKLLEELR
jgi:predicted CXXCH cytochrome family protein